MSVQCIIKYNSLDDINFAKHLQVFDHICVRLATNPGIGTFTEPFVY